MTHGGPRPGAGRPAGTAKPEAERKVSVSVRLTPELREKALRIGDGSLARGIALALAEF